MNRLDKPIFRSARPGLAFGAVLAIASSSFAADQSWAVPGAIDAAGNKVMTIINKDPPGAARKTLGDLAAWTAEADKVLVF